MTTTPQTTPADIQNVRTITAPSMTWELWRSMPESHRALIRDESALSDQLSGLEGWRVEVVTLSGETRRFYVGKSTGWRPCHLEIHNRRSMGGIPADNHYASVKRLYRR